MIEPADGLTVLVGPNNCGKSAVVSALLSVCGETDSNYMVRHGEKLASVTVETDDGHTIVWRRKKGSASYVIDGVEISRIGRGGPPFAAGSRTGASGSAPISRPGERDTGPGADRPPRRAVPATRQRRRRPAGTVSP